jgi:hypothetical protein
VEVLAPVAENAVLVFDSMPEPDLDAGSAPLLAEGVLGQGFAVAVEHVREEADSPRG